MEANLIHFLASDAHNLGPRNFYYQEAISVLKKEAGAELIYMLTENAALLAENKAVYKEPPSASWPAVSAGVFFNRRLHPV